MQNRIKLGYFPDWGNVPTLLFTAEEVLVLVELETLFRTLAADGGIIEIHELEFIEAHHGVNVRARLSEIDEGMQKVGDENHFIWSTTDAYWKEFADLISALRDENGMKHGHQYLDCSLSHDIQVIVSLNEYANDFCERFG